MAKHACHLCVMVHAFVNKTRTLCFIMLKIYILHVLILMTFKIYLIVLVIGLVVST